MSRLRRFLARSEHPCARLVRRAHRGCRSFSIPAPRIIVKPVLHGYLAGRTLWHAFRRVAIAEPLFKAYCKQYGRRLRTGIFMHFIEGAGDIVLGDDVFVDGKCSIGFSARYADAAPQAISIDHRSPAEPGAGAAAGMQSTSATGR